MYYKNLSQSEKEKKVNDILKSNPELTPLFKELEEKWNSSDQLLYLLSLEKKYREIDPMYWWLADSYEQKYNKLRYSKTMIMGLILDQIKAYNKINELEPSLKKIAENCIEKWYSNSNRNIERYGHIFALNQIDEYKKRILEFQNDSNPFFFREF